MRGIIQVSMDTATRSDEQVSDTIIGKKQVYLNGKDGMKGISLTLYKGDLPHNTYYGMYHNMVVHVLVVYNRMQEEW